MDQAERERVASNCQQDSWMGFSSRLAALRVQHIQDAGVVADWLRGSTLGVQVQASALLRRMAAMPWRITPGEHRLQVVVRAGRVWRLELRELPQVHVARIDLVESAA